MHEKYERTPLIKQRNDHHFLSPLAVTRVVKGPRLLMRIEAKKKRQDIIGIGKI